MQSQKRCNHMCLNALKTTSNVLVTIVSHSGICVMVTGTVQMERMRHSVVSESLNMIPNYKEIRSTYSINFT